MMNRTSVSRYESGARVAATAISLCGLAFLSGCQGFNPSVLLADIADLGEEVADLVARDIVDGVIDDFLSTLCEFRNDGQCDDGRPGAMTDACPFGTDSEDCDGIDDANGPPP